MDINSLESVLKLGDTDDENRNYVKELKDSMDLMKENLDGYNEYKEKN